MDDMIVAKPEMNPKKRTLAEGAVLLVILVVVILVRGGHPYSNWFYVLMGVGFLGAAYRTLKTEPRQPILADPPREVGAALKEAAAQGLFAGLFMFTFILTLTGELYQWTGGLFFGGLVGVQTYRSQRGKTTSLKYFILIMAALLLIMTIFVLWGTYPSNRS
jgi:hypothetical protein